jgi:RTX calcium-binding nonapeptide repeat (4 copies)
MSGGDGADGLSGELGFDIVSGGRGDDRIDGGDIADDLSGGRGNDTMLGGDGFDFVAGGLGDDDLAGQGGPDDLGGGRGNDRASGGAGIDFLEGGLGDDRLSGQADADDLAGGRGSDRLGGGDGRDRLSELSRRVEKVVGYPPLSEMGDYQRRQFHEALVDADSVEDLPGKWQAAIIKAESNRPKVRLVRDAWFPSSDAEFGRSSSFNVELESDDAQPECASEGDRSKRRERGQPRGAGDDKAPGE